MKIKPIESFDRNSATAADDWFLQRGRWEDDEWELCPTNKLEEEQPVRLRWDFPMPGGERFTSDRYSILRNDAKVLIAKLRAESLSGGGGLRGSTIENYYFILRRLLTWMTTVGMAAFADIEESDIARFRAAMQVHGRARRVVAASTLQKYMYLFAYLHRFRKHMQHGLGTHVFEGRRASDLVRVREADLGRLPYTPHDIAIELVSRAVQLVQEASVVLEARRIFVTTARATRKRGCGPDWQSVKGVAKLREARIKLVGGRVELGSQKDLARAIDALYGACFVVISYLVGPRVSEILHLQAGCARRTGASQVLVGSIFKKQKEYRGRPHEWVAPPIAVEAIAVLEKLSSGHRRASGRKDLWLRRTDHAGAMEWVETDSARLKVIGPYRANALLRRFVSWAQLRSTQGKRWRPTTHQGRKTFARFAALRDSTSLFALSQHLGHRERAITDYAYAGTDYRLLKEVDAATVEESIACWENMLASPTLGGRAGEQISSLRPKFNGSRMKEDLKSYARMLVDAGLTLGACAWGFCVYRQGTSACLGGATGPNPAKREPSVCVSCPNFAVSSKHAPYWKHEVARCHELLGEGALPLQSLRLVRQRLAEAGGILSAIEPKGPKE